MKVWAVFTIMISAVALAATIYFAPVEQNPRKIGIIENQIQYKGSFRSGFTEAGAFDGKSLTLFEFMPDPAKKAGLSGNQDIIVLLAPDKRADTANYRPYLQMLAEEGITVYSADFFADDGQWLHSIGDNKILRRLVMVIQSVLNNKKFTSEREYYSYNISQEYSVLVPLLQERCGAGKKFLFITDFMADIAAEDYQKKNPDTLAGILKLSSIDEYMTSGYGCIEQTDPLLAIVLGLRRDKKLTTPKLLAARTKEALNDLK